MIFVPLCIKMIKIILLFLISDFVIFHLLIFKRRLIKVLKYSDLSLNLIYQGWETILARGSILGLVHAGLD